MENIRFHGRRICQKIFGVTFPSRVKHFFHPVSHNGKITIFPTLECNLRCPYCPINFIGESSYSNPTDSFPVGEWIRAINKIQADVIISGGEPLLYPEICSLINGIDTHLEIEVFSNLSVSDLGVIIDQINRPVFFHASYHPVSGNPDKFISMLKRVSEKERFRFDIRSIGSKSQIDYLFKIQNYFLINGFKLNISVDAFELGNIGARKLFSKKVGCTKRVCNFGPDGNRYNCLTKMIKRESPLYSISKIMGDIQYNELICEYFGNCSPCDCIGERNIRYI